MMGGGQAAAGAAAPAADKPTSIADKQAARTFLRERIEKLQARLAELDAELDGVEDATVIAETPAAPSSNG